MWIKGEPYAVEANGFAGSWKIWFLGGWLNGKSWGSFIDDRNWGKSNGLGRLLCPDLYLLFVNWCLLLVCLFFLLLWQSIKTMPLDHALDLLLKLDMIAAVLYLRGPARNRRLSLRACSGRKVRIILLWLQHLHLILTIFQGEFACHGKGILG